MLIGILALQGAFQEHQDILDTLFVNTILIRQKKDLSYPLDGLILPGGESTTMKRLLKDLDMFDTIKQMIQNGLPVFGTCAGMILLSESISNDPEVCFGVLPVHIKRNAFGRQLGSFKMDGLFVNHVFPMVFIRAPYIEKVLSDEVNILSTYEEHITAVRYKNILATAFHPELTQDTSIHQYFLHMIQRK